MKVGGSSGGPAEAPRPSRLACCKVVGPRGIVWVTAVSAGAEVLWTGLDAARLAAPAPAPELRAWRGELVLRSGRRVAVGSSSARDVPVVLQTCDGRVVLRPLARGIDWRAECPGGRLELRRED